MVTVDRIGPTEVKIAGATIGNITVEYEYIKKIRRPIICWVLF